MRVADLQDESSKTDNTGQTSAGEGSGLASTVGNGRRNGRGDDTSASGGDNGGSGVGVAAASVARDNTGGDDWLGDGARAVRDGQSGGL